MIWGIDLGVRSLHAAGLPEDGEDDKAIMHSIDLRKGKSRYLELRALAMSLVDVIHPDDVVFVEEPPLAGRLNIRTFGQLSMTAGAILSATSAQGYLVPVSSWKKATVGSGSADKSAVALWLKGIWPIYYESCGDNQNLMDACCIAIYGRKLIGAAGRAGQARSGGLDIPV